MQCTVSLDLITMNTWFPDLWVRSEFWGDQVLEQVAVL